MCLAIHGYYSFDDVVLVGDASSDVAFLLVSQYLHLSMWLLFYSDVLFVGV